MNEDDNQPPPCATSQSGLGFDPVGPVNGRAVYNALLDVIQAQAAVNLCLEELIFDLINQRIRPMTLGDANRALGESRRQVESAYRELEILRRTLR
ncbi:MAG: hypothetical protein AB7G13_05575 [Lautropia sp.]